MPHRVGKPTEGLSRDVGQRALWRGLAGVGEARIADLEFFLVEMPAVGLAPASRSVVARLASDTGAEGWGEAAVAWRAGELVSRRDALLPQLADRSVFDTASLVEVDTLDSPAVRAALEIASWDLIGQMAAQPLAHLWGGMYRRRVPVAARLSEVDPDRASTLARELADQGFHTQIVTATGGVEVDRALVTAVRAAAGDRVELRFDAAARFDLEAVRSLCRALEACDIRYCLDPFAPDDRDALAELAVATALPLGLTLRAQGAQDALDAIRHEAADYFVIEPDRVGGLLAARRAAAVIDAAGLSASLAVGPRAGIALAAMLHLAAATPAFASGNECAYRQGCDDVLVAPHELIDGLITVPQAPGLGIVVDRDKLERLSVG